MSRVLQMPRTIILTKGLTQIKHNIIQDLAWAEKQKKKNKSQKKKEKKSNLALLGCPTNLKKCDFVQEVGFIL